MSMTAFSQEFIAELKSRNDLVEVASGYVSLERKGYNYWACCPFHHEKTPSFTIQASEQYYHCFGCGASGDVISLVMGMESLPFVEAVKRLAARANMPLPEASFDSEKTAELKRRKDRILSVLKTSARFYLRNLYSGAAGPHMDYITRREILPSTAKKFGLGASLDYDSLPRHLLESGFSSEEIVDSGVCSLTQRGQLIDAQANRLIIPIIDSFDEVIGFGGRILGKKAEREAKYKNTKETMVFNKRKALYNVNLLKRYKQKAAVNSVIIVEGYMDAISLYQAGFCNVVASMGTSLTQEQARLVKRFSENVYISYDGDFAGQSADLRGLEILRDEHLNVKVVLMPEGEDPDDVVRGRGPEAYRACLDGALPLVDYKLHSLGQKYDLTQSEGKRAYAQAAMPVIREASSAAEREDLLKTVRDRTGFTYQSLERDLENARPPEKQAQAAPEKARHDRSDSVQKASRFLIGAVLLGQPYAEGYELREEWFRDEVHREIVRYINRCREGGQPVRVSDLFEVFGEDTPEFNEILDLNTEEQLLGENSEKYFRDSERTLKRWLLQQEMGSLSARIGETEDAGERQELTQRLSGLVKELRQLK